MNDNFPKCNYHTHSTYCDGKDPISAFVQQAEKLQMTELGFSSHAPIPIANNFGIQESAISTYKNEIQQLQKNTPLNLYYGLECDFIPQITKPFHYYKDTYKLHYIIGGVHLVKHPQSQNVWFIDGSKREIYDQGLEQLFDNNIRKAVTAFWEQTFEMIETQTFDIIAHIDKIKMHNQNRFFTEDETWYRQLVDHAIELIHQKKIIIEINSRGIYKKRCPDFYPSDYILQKIAALDIPMIISSDAHQAEELSLGHIEAKEKLKSFGINHLMHIKNYQWESYAI